MPMSLLDPLPARAVIDREEFYVGLLVQLTRTSRARRTFSLNHEALRSRFVSALRAARDQPGGPRVNGIDWAVVEDANRQERFVNELIAFGQSSRFLSLTNPDLERGGLRPRSGPEVDALAAAVGYEDWFRHIGEAFVSST